MAFVENHDTYLCFLGEGKVLWLSKRLWHSSTVNRTPQLDDGNRGIDECTEERNRWQCPQGLPLAVGLVTSTMPLLPKENEAENLMFEPAQPIIALAPGQRIVYQGKHRPSLSTEGRCRSLPASIRERPS